MNALEIGGLLARASLVDNRNPDDEGIIMEWHRILGHLSYTVADEALTLVRQDPTVGYLEPKHIIAKAAIVQREIDKTLERCTRWRVNADGIKLDAGGRARLNSACNTRRAARRALES